MTARVMPPRASMAAPFRSDACNPCDRLSRMVRSVPGSLGVLDHRAVAGALLGQVVGLGLEFDQLGAEGDELAEAPVDVGHLDIEYAEHIVGWRRIAGRLRRATSG